MESSIHVAKRSTSKTEKDSGGNYHVLFEQATDAIMVTDFEGNFVDVNTSLCEMFGYSKNELLQMNVRSLLDLTDLTAKPIRFDLLAEGKTQLSERKMLDRDGTMIFVEKNAKKFAHNHQQDWTGPAGNMNQILTSVRLYTP